MRRSTILFLLADAASLLGNSFIAVVLPWLVLARTGDPAAAGVVAAATAAPAVIAALVGGWVVDRVGRRRISIISDLGSALAVAAIPLVDATAGLDLGWFVLLGALGALFDVPGMTARESLLPDVARAGGMSLDRLSGVREGLFGVTFLAGPALAGLALTAFEPTAVLVVTAAASALAALCTLLIPAAVGRRSADALAEPAARQLLGGLRVVAADPLLRAVTVLSIGSAAVLGPLQALLLPAWFSTTGSSAALGLTLSALALGTLVGAGTYAVAAGRMRRRTAYLLCLLCVSTGMLLLASLAHPLVVALAMFVCGLGSGLLSPVVPVVVAGRVPESHRGRVFGVQNAVVMLLAPLAVGLAGAVAASSLEWAFYAATALWLATALYGALVPGMRSLDEPATTCEETPAEQRC
ncbi:MFS transporter [Auraticoccus cholistanensis]|uniref:MFS transporter n=1 Tax=Auraticoccus cholistanensis TaxID=2656650 RepID=UPI0018D22B94